MENTITNRQMVFILFLTLTTSAVIGVAKTIAENAGVGGWFSLLIASLIFAVLVFIIVKLNTMFQGKMLFDYSKEIVGKFMAVVIAMFYIFYFINISTTLCINQCHLLKNEFLRNTPEWATSFVLLFVSGYAVYKGITNVARLFEIYGVLFFIVATTIHIMMAVNGNIEYIMPFYIPSETGKYLKAIKNAIFPFLGIEVLTIIPFTIKNGKKAAKIALFALLAIGIIYVFEAETTIMMVGMNEIVHYPFAAITAIRQVEITFLDFLRRFDILVMTAIFMSSYAGIIITYLCVVEYLSRLLPKVKRVIIVPIIGVLIFVLRIIAGEINVYEKIFNEAVIYIGLVAAAIIPVTLFIIAKVKKSAKN